MIITNIIILYYHIACIKPECISQVQYALLNIVRRLYQITVVSYRIKQTKSVNLNLRCKVFTSAQGTYSITFHHGSKT